MHQHQSNCNQKECANESCCCSCHEHSQESGKCDMLQYLLSVADEAWQEVLKEKIKEHILANDHKMTDIANLVAEANHLRWENKIAKEKLSKKYEQKIKDLFGKCEECKPEGAVENKSKW